MGAQLTTVIGSATPYPGRWWASDDLKGTVVITLAGVIDASGKEGLEHLLRDLVEDQGNQFVTVDLSGVERWTSRC